MGVRGVKWGQKIKYGSKCLKLPNSSRKVVFSILKISGQNEKYLEKFQCRKFSKYFANKVKKFQN